MSEPTLLPRRTLAKVTIMLASSLTVMSGATISPSLPQMKEVFSGIPEAEFLTKMLLSLPALFIALGSPLVGQVIDRYGRLPIMFASMVLYAIAGTAGFFMDNIYYILISRGLLGLSVAGILPVCMALIGDYFEGKERQQMTALQGAAMAMGGVVFVGLGGLLADVSWRTPFLIYLFSLVVLVLAIVSLKEPPRKAISAVKESFFKQLKPIYYALVLTGLLTMVAFYMIPIQLPFLLKDLGVEKNALIGLAIMTNTFFSVLVAANYKFLRARVGFAGLSFILFLLMGAGYFIISQAPDYGWVVGGLVLTGLGLGIFMPNGNLWVLEMVPESIRGRAVGMVSSAIFLGQFLSPYFVNPLLGIDGVELPDTFAVAAVLLVLLGVAYGILALKSRRQSPGPD